nr:MAG TPA: hypothetical protein [Caudoviricetes sp.]
MKDRLNQIQTIFLFQIIEETPLNQYFRGYFFISA